MEVNNEGVYEMDGGLVRAVVDPNGEDSYRESVVVGGETVGILTSGSSGFTYLFRGGLGSVEAYADAGGAGLGGFGVRGESGGELRESAGIYRGSGSGYARGDGAWGAGIRSGVRALDESGSGGGECESVWVCGG